MAGANLNWTLCNLMAQRLEAMQQQLQKLLERSLKNIAPCHSQKRWAIVGVGLLSYQEPEPAMGSG